MPGNSGEISDQQIKKDKVILHFPLLLSSYKRSVWEYLIGRLLTIQLIDRLLEEVMISMCSSSLGEEFSLLNVAFEMPPPPFPFTVKQRERNDKFAICRDLV